LTLWMMREIFIKISPLTKPPRSEYGCGIYTLKKLA
jgi:hypothetical protein